MLPSSSSIENPATVQQPIPEHDNVRPDIWLLVIEDMKERRQFGINKYHGPLQPFNGQNALIAAYQEALDLAAYLKQKILEEQAKIDQAT